MKIAEAIEAKLVDLGSQMTDKAMVACFNEYRSEIVCAVMAADSTNFVISFNDGSCIRITFGADHIRAEVGEDMEYVPKGTHLNG